MTCNQCRYYLPHATMPDRGYCRRYPPPGLQHPPVYANNWCGEFDPPAITINVDFDPKMLLNAVPGQVIPANPEQRTERVKAPRRKKGPTQPEETED